MSLYADLDSGRQEFRLMRFVGSDNKDLNWGLETFSLHDDVSWTALSYCWGETTATDEITVDGHTFLVRNNLFRFLAQMAAEDRRDWFFVDAVCINQDDIVERGSQVSLMGNIYRKAQEVIAWIFPDDNVLEHAVPEIQLMSKRFSDAKGFANGTAVDDAGQKGDQSFVNAMEAVVAKSGYWLRLWIVQEVLLARKVTIRCYSLAFKWADIATVIPKRLNHSVHGLDSSNERSRLSRGADRFIRNSFDIHEVRLSRSTSWYMFSQLRKWSEIVCDDLRRGTLVDFYEAVVFFSGQHCTEVHDCIFGLLGIAKCYIRPDYTMPIVDLYAAALYSCVLSKWATRPAQGGPHSDDEQSPSETQPSLGLAGLARTDLAYFSDVLMQALKLEPFDDVVFLINHEVFERFVPERLHDPNHAAEVFAWITTAGSIRHASNVLRPRIGINDDIENPNEAKSTPNISLRLVDTLARLKAAEENDGEIRGHGAIGEAIRYSERRKKIHSICDEIWARYEADQQE